MAAVPLTHLGQLFAGTSLCLTQRIAVGVDSAGSERSLGPLEAASSCPCGDTFSPRQPQRIPIKR
ncbi:hypothetical protein E2C01_040047 [Portunus trituberculatus]|uniref:Uncharacterized protein n=1 Tax=Portunus trituberculatus TaxID=210409 RepID=A0A5B7FFE4_PORTR|nr:hypothetical protein [Portunus trituberculatus]